MGNCVQAADFLRDCATTAAFVRPLFLAILGDCPEVDVGPNCRSMSEYPVDDYAANVAANLDPGPPCVEDSERAVKVCPGERPVAATTSGYMQQVATCINATITSDPMWRGCLSGNRVYLKEPQAGSKLGSRTTNADERSPHWYCINMTGFESDLEIPRQSYHVLHTARTPHARPTARHC